MILIISSQNDFSTNDVIDWLLYYRHPFLRISQNDTIEIRHIKITNGKPEVVFRVRGHEYNTKDISSIWYRRSYIAVNNSGLEMKTKSLLKYSLNNHIRNEKIIASDFLNYLLFKTSINKLDDCTLNKLVVLQMAADAGLLIPYTEVIGTKKDLTRLSKKYSLINKTLTQGVFINSKKEIVNSFAVKVDPKDIEEFPEIFLPTLFQEQIDKMIELRVFFLEKQFYASAIFSQNDPQTSIDFRNYNFTCPNRTPPFQLPIEVQQKLERLMDKLKLNSGSIDLILSKKGEYVFLEVNPIGQFKQVSKPCNYHLEHLIANKLISNDKKI